MVRLVLSVLGGLLLGTVSLLSAQDWPVRQVLPSLGRMEVVSAGGEEVETFCTSVAISKTIALTAAHCISETPGDQHFIDGNRASVPLDANPIGDILPLRVDRPLLKPITLGPEPRVGDQLFTFGYGMNAPQPFMFTGALLSLRMTTPSGEETLMFMSISNVPGMSGGPVTNSQGGLVALIVGAFNPSGHLQNIGTATLYADLKAAWAKWR